MSRGIEFICGPCSGGPTGNMSVAMEVREDKRGALDEHDPVSAVDESGVGVVDNYSGGI